MPERQLTILDVDIRRARIVKISWQRLALAHTSARLAPAVQRELSKGAQGFLRPVLGLLSSLSRPLTPRSLGIVVLGRPGQLDRREAASRGFWVANRTPYGYNRVMVQDGAKKRPKLEPNELTAPVVKRIFELADTGRGMLDIAHTLNDEGITSATGKLWSKNGVHFILTNEVYTGTLIWGTAARCSTEPASGDFCPSLGEREGGPSLCPKPLSHRNTPGGSYALPSRSSPALAMKPIGSSPISAICSRKTCGKLDGLMNSYKTGEWRRRRDIPAALGSYATFQTIHRIVSSSPARTAASAVAW